MAFLIVGSIAALVVGAEKLHEHRKAKRASKAQALLLQHGSVQEISIVDDTTARHHHQMDDLPAYYKEKLPPYQVLDEHPAFRANKQSASSPHS